MKPGARLELYLAGFFLSMLAAVAVASWWVTQRPSPAESFPAAGNVNTVEARRNNESASTRQLNNPRDSARPPAAKAGDAGDQQAASRVSF